MPSFWNIVVNTIGCSKAFREKKKFTKRGMERLEKDFDILKIIKKVESIAVASFISLSFPQKQIALRLSQRVLSDNNNSSEEDNNYIEKDDFNLANDFSYLKYFLKMKKQNAKLCL